MRTFLLILLTMFCAAGCGDKKPKALNAVENAVDSATDAAAKKAKSVENFAKDRLEVKD
jgi:hypothetical protein